MALIVSGNGNSLSADSVKCLILGIGLHCFVVADKSKYQKDHEYDRWDGPLARHRITLILINLPH